MSRIHAGILAVSLCAVAVGCSTPGGAQKGGDEGPAREAFESLQQAIKAKDADKMWALLDEDSQADAEREAGGIRDAYAKADDAGKKELEKNLGLPGAKLAGLKGPGFLETRRFLGKYDEVADSKVEKVTVEKDRATVNYLEPDGDKEKFTLTRQQGKWKLSVPMPKGTPR